MAPAPAPLRCRRGRWRRRFPARRDGAEEALTSTAATPIPIHRCILAAHSPFFYDLVRSAVCWAVAWASWSWVLLGANDWNFTASQAKKWFHPAEFSSGECPGKLQRVEMLLAPQIN